MIKNVLSAESSNSPLPPVLAQFTDYGLYALLLGLPLMGIALVTNPVPDPSFPWATLPDSLRLFQPQPRIEHWPVTYTIGIWLWVFGFPALFLKAFQRFTHRTSLASSFWLTLLPTVAMFGWTTYCRFFWPKLYPPTWNAPSYTFVCWLYCSSYDPLWSNLAYGVVALGAIATILAYRRPKLATYALATFGVLAFPLGIPAIYDAYRRHAD